MCTTKKTEHNIAHFFIYFILFPQQHYTLTLHYYIAYTILNVYRNLPSYIYSTSLHIGIKKSMQTTSEIFV